MSEDNDLLRNDDSERSIRNLRVTRRRGPIDAMPVRPRRTSRWFTFLAWGSITLVALFIAAITYFAFQHTKVTIVPLAHRVQFTPELTIRALPLGSSTSSLSYATESVSVEDSETITVTGTKEVMRKATGKITVYNSFDTAPVQLVKDTRFETPEGIIFRAAENFSVPGKKGTTPGSITINVVADKEGATGNVGPTLKFTVPGLKTNPSKFAGVYAKSDAPMTGGASGTEPSMDDAQREATVEKLKASLKNKISAELSKFGTSSMALTDLAEISYVVSPPALSGSNTAVFKVTATAKVPVLSAADFASGIASAVGFDTGAIPFAVVPLSDFSSMHGSSSALRDSGSYSLGFDPIIIRLKGSAQLVPQFSEKAIATRLAGRDSAELQKLVNEYIHIKSAITKIEPFWSSSFPTDIRNIEVNLLPAQE